VKLKRGINLTKESKKRKIKRMNTTLKKKIHQKLRLNDLIEKKLKI
jgi:hypothetical protein